MSEWFERRNGEICFELRFFSCVNISSVSWLHNFSFFMPSNIQKHLEQGFFYVYITLGVVETFISGKVYRMFVDINQASHEKASLFSLVFYDSSLALNHSALFIYTSTSDGKKRRTKWKWETAFASGRMAADLYRVQLATFHSLLIVDTKRHNRRGFYGLPFNVTD